MKFSLTIAAVTLFVAAGERTANATPIILDLTSGVLTSTTYSEDGFTLQAVPAGNHLDPGYSEGIYWHDGPANPVPDNLVELTFNGGDFDFTGLEFGSINNFAVLVTGSNGASWTTSSGISGLQQPPSGAFSNVSWIRFNNASLVYLSTLFVNNASNASPVPEPTTTILLATGGLGLVGGAIRRRRVRKGVAV